ncbi:hypothetical protein GGR50DRAFT_642077, partial [Xylaria sp. CBS 124048]
MVLLCALASQLMMSRTISSARAKHKGLGKPVKAKVEWAITHGWTCPTCHHRQSRSGRCFFKSRLSSILIIQLAAWPRLIVPKTLRYSRFSDDLQSSAF